MTETNKYRREIDVFDCCDGNNVVRKSADEVISERAGGSSRVPVKLRDDKFDLLPDSELLKVLHYYISLKYPNKIRIFEETSLITMGLLVEQWIDEIIGETSAQMYAEFANGFGAESQTPTGIAKKKKLTVTGKKRRQPYKKTKRKIDSSSKAQSSSSDSESYSSD